MSREAFYGFLFGAALFFLMGLTLACDAEHHAHAALDWERLVLGAAAQRRERPGRRAKILWAYRFGGLLFSTFGFLLAVAALSFPRFLSARFKPAELTQVSRILGGLLFIVMGLLLSSFKIAEVAKPSRLPGGLGDDLLAESERGWKRRIASASGWLMIVCFLAFGLFLLSRPA